MKKLLFLILVLCQISGTSSKAQLAPKEKGLEAITIDAIKGQLEFLASDCVIAWMAAMHPDYHQPSDQVNLVNWDKMLNIIKLGYLQMWEAANGEIK